MRPNQKAIDDFAAEFKTLLEDWCDSGYDRNGVAIASDLTNLKRIEVSAVDGFAFSIRPECDPNIDPKVSYGGFWTDEGSDCDGEVTSNHGKKDDESVVQVHASPKRGFEFI